MMTQLITQLTLISLLILLIISPAIIASRVDLDAAAPDQD